MVLLMENWNLRKPHQRSDCVHRYQIWLLSERCGDTKGITGVLYFRRKLFHGILPGRMQKIGLNRLLWVKGPISGGHTSIFPVLEKYVQVPRVEKCTRCFVTYNHLCFRTSIVLADWFIWLVFCIKRRLCNMWSGISHAILSYQCSSVVILKLFSHVFAL